MRASVQALFAAALLALGVIAATALAQDPPLSDYGSTVPTTPSSTVVAANPGSASLSGRPSGNCARKAFTATVKGTSISKVSFYIDGRLVKTVRRTSSKTKYRLSIVPRRVGFGTHRVEARVTFTNGSQSSPVSRTMRFRRCARKAASPTFTG